MRAVALALFLGWSTFAQLPKPFYAWWNSPVTQDLNLTDDQKQRIRATVKEYRPHLAELRAEIDRLEADLEYQFNQQSVDAKKASDAIDKLAAVRADLTRTISQMSLKLRSVLTQEQWQELQKRRPPKNQAQQSPEPAK